MSPNNSSSRKERPTRVATPQGVLYFKRASLDLVKRLDALLPLGLVISGDTGTDIRFGITMVDGSRELRFLKQQPPEVSEDEAGTLLLANRILVASCLARFQVESGNGLFWPIFYRRRKPQGVEAGIAYLGRGNDPSLSGIDGVETAFDDDFSPGFTQALFHFVEMLKAESQVTGITLQPCIGLDVRNAGQLGVLDFDFLVLDSEVVCLKAEVDPKDPIWTVIRSQGIDTVIHIPALPLAL